MDLLKHYRYAIISSVLLLLLLLLLFGLNIYSEHLFAFVHFLTLHFPHSNPVKTDLDLFQVY